MLETKSAGFTFVKQGIYYFSRRVPSDLSHHYKTGRIFYPLRTKSASVAQSRALRAAQKLDEHWYHLRLRDVELPGQNLLKSGAATIDTSPLTPRPASRPDRQDIEPCGRSRARRFRPPPSLDDFLTS